MRESRRIKARLDKASSLDDVGLDAAADDGCFQAGIRCDSKGNMPTHPAAHSKRNAGKIAGKGDRCCVSGGLFQPCRLTVFFTTDRAKRRQRIERSIKYYEGNRYLSFAGGRYSTGLGGRRSQRSKTQIGRKADVPNELTRLVFRQLDDIW